MQLQVKNALQVLQETRSLFRVPRLHSEQWQDKIFAIFFRGMFYKNQNTTKARMESVISHYELMEQVSLLELAVWKAACLEDMPQAAKKGYMQITAWFRSGWKTLKEQNRRCGAIGTVLSGVLPFLQSCTQ